jgi:DNA-binding PadR family transcriptional regulator
MARKVSPMNRRDWLLLAVGDYIEPIQLQKTMFKFAKEAGAPAAECYEFRPYNWGPMASDIYPDLGELRAAGLIEYVQGGTGWNAYKLTAKGEEQAERLRRRAPIGLVSELDSKRAWVKRRRFRRLLRDVYKDYPEFAKDSLFRP